MLITNSSKVVPLIKYVIYKNNKKFNTSYSQVHDQFLGIKENNSIKDQINKDIKFYRQNKINDVIIKVYVNNEFYKEYKI